MVWRRILEIALVALPIAAAPTHSAVCGEPARGAPRLDFLCDGQLEPGRPARASDARSSVEFEVTAHFGEGEILAMVDPDTSKIELILYDAEVTSGSLRFKDGDERRVIWTRMSGVTGPLVGEAIASDGNVVALSIEQEARDGVERPFALFSAADGSAYRGVCRPGPGPD